MRPQLRTRQWRMSRHAVWNRVGQKRWDPSGRAKDVENSKTRGCSGRKLLALVKEKS